MMATIGGSLWFLQPPMQRILSRIDSPLVLLSKSPDGQLRIRDSETTIKVNSAFWRRDLGFGWKKGKLSQNTVFLVKFHNNRILQTLQVVLSEVFIAAPDPAKRATSTKCTFQKWTFVPQNHHFYCAFLSPGAAKNPAFLVLACFAGSGLLPEVLLSSRGFLEELRSFHSKWYLPENATLYVVGDVAPDKVLPAVENIFGGLGGQWQQDCDARPRALECK